MIRRNIEELTNYNSPTVDPEAIVSPPPPKASPAIRTSMSEVPEAPSSPAILATMTPVNVLELKKDVNKRPDAQDSEVYQVKTEMIYSDKEDSDIYPSIHDSDKHENSLDLIYEDGNKTVIYTTSDQPNLGIYSSKNDEITINVNPESHLHAQLSNVLIHADNNQVIDDGPCERSNPPGTVSVVLQGGGQGLLQYSQAPIPPNTVLVFSELVDDMSPVPVIGLRKRKNSNQCVTANIEEVQPNSGGISPLQGATARMAELSSDQHQPGSGSGTDHEQQTWRAYYEHPLTAATTAMLNISGGAAEDQTSTMGFIYEYYKLPPLSTEPTKDKIADMWTPGSQSSGVLTSQLKAANGLVSGAGLEIATPSGSTTLSTGQLAAQDIGLFINQHVGYAQPVSTASGQSLQIVKREPEDLSHHRRLETTSPDLENSNSGIIIGGRQRPKVVLLSSNPQPNDLVVDVNNTHGVIKDEVHIHRGLNSPQHGSRSINGTPTSTHSSLLADGPNAGPIEVISADGLKSTMYTTQIFASIPNTTHGSASGSPSPVPYSDHITQYSQSLSGTTSGGYITSANVRSSSGGTSFTITDPYYREYFTTVTSGPGTPEPVYTTQLRQNQLGSYVETSSESSSAVATVNFVERYVRQSSIYHSKGVIAAATAAGLTVDLPSPDSGIGADAVTPRDQNNLQQSFDYTELCQANSGLLDPVTLSAQRSSSTGTSPSNGSGGRSRPWHDFGRQNDADKIQIPKLYSPVGFKYHLETPISTSQRREDDRITYINKGQFYGITLEYVSDPDKPLKSQTVKSIVMLMFREEKSPEDEIKAWQFWHGRQHSVKQRILDADTKNSVGLVGCIEEVAHNAIAIYWNPLDSPAKINVAVQCLSTDFSSQKGVKGLPLHLQIDTYEDPRETTVFHRGYCQIKVFCDKGAERKTRDEERRAAKRKMTATGRKKLDELYHPVSERSEFYSMSDLTKPPVLFTPAEDIDKLTSMELQGFYNHDTDSSLSGVGQSEGSQHLKSGSPFLLHTATKSPITPTLKFHNHFPQDADKKEGLLDASITTDGSVFSPPIKRPKLIGGPGNAGPPPLNERVMLYVRQESEEVYTPLHVVPPTTVGLLNAIEHKYKIDSSRVNSLFRKNRKGIMAKIDDEMVTYYCNEDLFLLEVKAVGGVDEELYDITFIELSGH